MSALSGSERLTKSIEQKNRTDSMVDDRLFCGSIVIWDNSSGMDLAAEGRDIHCDDGGGA